MADQLTKKVDPLDYDSGVSNGDVDWLFRGKSKKLTKKMNLSKEEKGDDKKDDKKEKDDKKDKEDLKDKSKDQIAPEKSHTATQSRHQQTEKIDPSTVGPKGSGDKPNIKSDVASDGKKVDADENKDEKDDIRSSKLDKLFRPRSSSASKPECKAKPKERPKDKKFNLINYSGSSFSGASIYNSSFEHAYLDSSIPLVVGPGTGQRVSSSGSATSSTSNSGTQAANSTVGSTPNISTVSSNGSNSSSVPPISPKQRSRSSSVGSNSSQTKEKKGLFSSLSAKFKSNPSPSSSPVVPSYLSEMAANASPKDKEEHPKLNPNHLNAGNAKDDSLYNSTRPPMDISGIPIKRRNSVQDQPGNSLDKISSPGSSFNSFFKRKSSTSSNASGTTPCSSSRVILNKNPNKPKSHFKELEDVDLKRVNFAIDKLAFDPQQQIPSRRPKKGNVLIPEELLAPPPRLSQGISLSDGNKNTDQAPKYSEKELNLAIEAQKRALIEAEKHASEAHLSAKRIAYEVSQYKHKYNVHNQTIFENDEATTIGSMEIDDTESQQDDIQDAEDSKHTEELRKIEIDKPLHFHENHFDETSEPVDVGALSLEQIYTRCCHLREILPIPATLKQLKNKTKPLSVLKLLNPKPTLIDILSFSDFIAIVPITTVIFDNVAMTTEMLKHILSSLAYNKAVEKLSLRNVPIDETGWKYLCMFLSSNQSIKKLDISQQRIKSDTKPSLIRSSMNWDLFIRCLVARGGIEELVINGSKLTDETFKELVESAVSISTFRLGIASCDLNLFKTSVVCNWLKSPDCKCVGVDVAFNDLSQGQLKYFIDCFNGGNAKLIFFSLYQTNLSNVEETSELLKSLTKVKTLRFLDLSSLPDLFPGIISKLNVHLPKLESLKRIHFDLNELTPPSMIAIAEILPKIRGLLHVSFLGNRNLNSSVAGSIYGAIKKSPSIFTLDLDYDLVNDELNQRIAFYLMRNMDNIVNINIDNNNTFKLAEPKKVEEEEELMFDGSLLMETAEKLLIENEKRTSNRVEDIKLNKIISDALIERTRELRSGIHKTIDTLFDRRNKGILSLEGKENLLRFCLLDSSLEKLVHLFEEQANKSSSMAMSPASSVEETNSANPSDVSTVLPPDSSDMAKSASIKHSLSSGSQGSRKGHPIIDLGEKVLLHQSSNELITSGPILSPRNTETLNKLGFFPQMSESSTFQPHQVVVESNSDGRSVPIDNFTGRPVLMRSISQTSTHAKEQELEEGEFHRWGFFMEQRNNSSNDLKNAGKPPKPTDSSSSSGSASGSQSPATDDKTSLSTTNTAVSKKADPNSLPTLNVLPSGSELREAIIKAKGIESITDLIDKINNERISLDKIYSITDKAQQAELLEHFEKMKLEQMQKEEEKTETEKSDDNESIDSMDEHGHVVDAVVDEVYDKLLNDAERVRSNK